VHLQALGDFADMGLIRLKHNEAWGHSAHPLHHHHHHHHHASGGELHYNILPGAVPPPLVLSGHAASLTPY